MCEKQHNLKPKQMIREKFSNLQNIMFQKIETVWLSSGKPYDLS